MLKNTLIYVDRYICLEDVALETAEDFIRCEHWSRPYMNNANTIIIFTGGRWTAHIEGATYSFAPGELCLVRRLESLLLAPKEYPCSFQRLSFSAHYFRVIDPEELLCSPFEGRPFGVGNKITSVEYDSSRLLGNLRAIAAQPEAPLRRLSLVVSLAELLHDLMRRPAEAVDTRPEEARMIIDYLNEHYFEDLDIDLLARRVFTSRTKLSRLMKEYTGYTIWDYILNKRIFRAIQLLHAGLSNQEAAQQVGFKNYSTFYKAFLRITGATPTVEHPTSQDNPLLPNYYNVDLAKQWMAERYGLDLDAIETEI